MSADRARIEELLQDPSLSFRAISRATGISDWSVRRLARLQSGDARPMRKRRAGSHDLPSKDPSPPVGWLVFGGFVAALGLAVWAGVHWAPPLDSSDFFHGFYSDPLTERTNDETQFPE